MSVFKKTDKSPYYQYDFEIHKRRFHGSTKTSDKKEAIAIEKALKEKAKAEIKDEINAGKVPLTFDIAAGRFYQEVGINHINSRDTFRRLGKLVKFFGAQTRLDEITDEDVVKAIQWRRNQKRWGRQKYKDKRPMTLVSPRTVNMDVTRLLKQLFRHAKLVWKYDLPNEPYWKKLFLKEPQERVRELNRDEGLRIEAAIGEQYAPWLEFARLTGWRFKETFLRWSNVNWEVGTIRNMGKGSREVITPITDEIRDLLRPLIGHHPEFVFTYVAKLNSKTKKRGKRYPINYHSAQSRWRRTIAAAGVQNFRFHDLRHDLATKTLRETGNLKLVSRILGHTNITTTMKYAHVNQDDIADALHRVAMSRKKSRTQDGA